MAHEVPKNMTKKLIVTCRYAILLICKCIYSLLRCVRIICHEKFYKVLLKYIKTIKPIVHVLRLFVQLNVNLLKRTSHNIIKFNSYNVLHMDITYTYSYNISMITGDDFLNFED